jgi:hypothetical protein
VDGHDLTDRAALDEYDGAADSTALYTPAFSSFDTFGDERVAVGDVRSRDDVCSFHGNQRSSVRLSKSGI